MNASADWPIILSSSLKSLSEWNNFLAKKPDHPKWSKINASKLTHTNFPLLILPSLAEEIWKQGPEGPLALSFLPTAQEDQKEEQSRGLLDPIGDQRFKAVDGLIHRYEGRCLLLPLSHCPVHCRFCFRRNELNEDKNLFRINFETIKNYLKAHPEINEVILTGGDPLILRTST